MGSALALPASETEAIRRRLRRIEGQVRALERMLAEERDCAEVAQQVAAARAALDRVALDLVAAGMEKCLRAEAADRPQAKPAMDKLRRAFLMLR